MPNIKFIEFLGDKDGNGGVLTFLDENREPVEIGVYKLNRFAFEVMHKEFANWLNSSSGMETIEIT